MAETAKHGGTIFRGADGSVYFVRDEILEACKLSGEELEKAEQTLAERKQPEVEVFGLQGGLEAVRFEGLMPALQFKQIGAGAYSTVMCCW